MDSEKLQVNSTTAALFLNELVGALLTDGIIEIDIVPDNATVHVQQATALHPILETLKCSRLRHSQTRGCASADVLQSSGLVTPEGHRRHLVNQRSPGRWDSSSPPPPNMSWNAGSSLSCSRLLPDHTDSLQIIKKASDRSPRINIRKAQQKKKETCDDNREMTREEASDDFKHTTCVDEEFQNVDEQRSYNSFEMERRNNHSRMRQQRRRVLRKSIEGRAAISTNDSLCDKASHVYNTNINDPPTYPKRRISVDLPYEMDLSTSSTTCSKPPMVPARRASLENEGSFLSPDGRPARSISSESTVSNHYPTMINDVKQSSDAPIGNLRSKGRFTADKFQLPWSIQDDMNHFQKLTPPERRDYLDIFPTTTTIQRKRTMKKVDSIPKKGSSIHTSSTESGSYETDQTKGFNLKNICAPLTIEDETEGK